MRGLTGKTVIVTGGGGGIGGAIGGLVAYLIFNGYGASTSSAFGSESKEALDNLQLPADPETMLKTTIFTGPMKQNDDLAKMFEKVKAGG